MACFSSMSGLLPAVVLVLVVLTGTETGGGQGAAAESEQSPGLSGSWWGSVGGRVWAARGAGALLQCALGATLPAHTWVNVTWLHNNTTVLDRRHLLTPAGHLNITKMVHRRSGATDEGEYRCLITTRQGTITGPPVTLRLASLTKNFIVTPSNVTVVVGEALRLSCQIDSQPPASLTWTHDQQPLPQDNRYTTPFSGVLHITEVQRTDSGIYRCLATNSVAGKERRSSAISVTVLDREEEDSYKPPTFLSPNKPFPFLSPKEPLRVIQGEDAIIECLATGVPLPTISWQRKLNESETKGWEDIKNGTKGILIIGQGTLVVSSVQNMSAGRYACTAKSVNPATQREATVSQEIELDVLVPPEIVDPPKPLDTLLAKTSRLNCSVMGHPIPRVIWYKNGQPVNIKGGTIQTTSNQLVFTNSITSDTGMYQCLAINDAGYASSWAPMVINSSNNHPHPPQNLHYVVLSSTSVLLTWDPVYPPSDKIKAYSIHYSQSEGSGIERQAVSQNASHLLESLKPNTMYTAFVRAYNNFASDVSEKLVFSTAEDVPSGAPSVLLTPKSPTVLLVTWGKLPPEQARGTIIGYKIHWRKLNHHYYHVIEVSADVHEFEIPDLHPGKKYEVQVLAGTKVGYPTKNDLPWIRQKMPSRSQKNIPLPPVVTLKVINETSEDDSKKLAIKIDWKLPPENTAELEGYVLKYRRQGRPWTSPIRLLPSETSYTIMGLEADWYDVQVKAFSADGDGAPTEHMVQTFPPSPNTTLPPNTTWSIYQLEAEPRSQTSIHLSWKLMEGQEGANYYTVKYRQVVLSQNTAKATLVCSENSVIDITGLKPFSTYEFSVRAHKSEKVYGPFSPIVQAITMENLPSAPDGFTYEPTDASTIRLKWSIPEDTAMSIQKYEILFTLDKSKPLSKWDVQEVDGKDATDTVGGLVSNTEYWFSIRGCTAIGCGATTQPLSATIPAILHPDPSLSTQNLYLISGSVAFVFLLLIIPIIIYLIKFRNIPSQPRVLACNGNGHINGKRSTQGMNIGQPDTQSDIEAQEMEVYIPMLTQIPADFKSPPLDTKGGYSDSRVNGLNNPRCNGYIRSRDELEPGLRAEAQSGSEEENERLVICASSSNGSISRSAVSKAHQNHHQESGKQVGVGEQCSQSPSGISPPSPILQHNHSVASKEDFADLTNLTTLSDSEGGMEQDATMVVGDTGYHHVNKPHQHNHPQHNTGATRASSPRPPLTTVQ
ncbi:protogenin B isoform X2 [Procambarus clarkii]|uniref:protogenin B isoform X2 n=1 Tax=Procambarus clarkii TaxID=6728 RepID=UPI001E678B47|nr:protogenin B-like isoform X1 [Procambarus clarkii]